MWPVPCVGGNWSNDGVVTPYNTNYRFLYVVCSFNYSRDTAFAILQLQGKDVLRIWKLPAWRNQLLLFSIVGMLGVQFTFVKSIEESNAIVATLLQFLAPIFIVIYISVMQKKLPPKAQVIGIAGTLAGLFLLLTNGSFQTLMVSSTALVWGVARLYVCVLHALPSPADEGVGRSCCSSMGAAAQRY